MKIILSPGLSKVLEEDNFLYSSLGKALEKQIKTLECQQNIREVGLLNNNGKNLKSIWWNNRVNWSNKLWSLNTLF